MINLLNNIIVSILQKGGSKTIKKIQSIDTKKSSKGKSKSKGKTTKLKTPKVKTPKVKTTKVKTPKLTDPLLPIVSTSKSGE